MGPALVVGGTKLARGGFGGHALFGTQASVHLRGDAVEAWRALVDDAQEAPAVARHRPCGREDGRGALPGRVAMVIVADGILELVDLGELGIELVAEGLQLRLLRLELAVPLHQHLLQTSQAASEKLRLPLQSSTAGGNLHPKPRP